MQQLMQIAAAAALVVCSEPRAEALLLTQQAAAVVMRLRAVVRVTMALRMVLVLLPVARTQQYMQLGKPSING
jgi:hypothetical protein